MMHQKGYFVQCLHNRCKVGGFFCGCCSPRERVERKKIVRAARRKLKQNIYKIETKEDN